MSFFPEKSSAEVIDKIVAQVGSQIVTLYDVQKFAPSIVRSINGMENGPEKDEAWNAYYTEAIEFVIYDKTLEIAAARMGVDATDQEIEDMVVVLQDQNTQFRAQVRAILDREGEVTPELFLFVKQIILKNKLSSILLSRAIVTEYDIKSYLRQNKPDFQADQTEYNVDIVFLPDNNEFNIFQNAIQHGTLESSAEEAGESVVNMGWIRLEHLVENMQKELLSLHDGEVSNGIQDENGRYVVMRLNGTRTVTNIPDDERNAITYTLREQQLNTIFMNWLERQKQSIIVNRYP